jgi:hypothetical protein
VATKQNITNYILFEFIPAIKQPATKVTLHSGIKASNAIAGINLKSAMAGPIQQVLPTLSEAERFLNQQEIELQPANAGCSEKGLDFEEPEEGDEEISSFLGTWEHVLLSAATIFRDYEEEGSSGEEIEGAEEVEKEVEGGKEGGEEGEEEEEEEGEEEEVPLQRKRKIHLGL